MFQILVIDDDTAVQELLRRTLKKQGYEVTVASNGEDGVAQAQKLRPALIICDWIMPRLTGIDVCRRVKADPDLSTTQFFLLTSLGSIADRVKGLDAGADDFISKPIELNELQARVRAGLRLHQLSRDLKIAKQNLEAELAEAAEYVQSLLPDPMTEPFSIEAKFIPSRQLGGDCFDYNWLDADYLAIYLLDVAGHGLRAALPSVTVLSLLRSRTLPNVDYYKPSDVLRALNTTFQMSYQNDKYFTIWYGVYNRIERKLVYASAGHPPAVLISQSSSSNPKVQQLKTPGMPVGMFPDAPYVDNCCDVEDLSTLYIFSDGVYEIHQPDGNIWGLDPFIDLLAAYNGGTADQLELVLRYTQKLNAKAVFDDDWSLLKVNFG
ncbi:MAG: PP2C family protein-serine/threonine phosphatase [Microcoleus sp.]